MEHKSKLRVLKIAGVTIVNLVCLFSIIYCVITTLGKGQAISEETQVRVIKEFEAPATQTQQTTQAPQAAQVQQAAQTQQTTQAPQAAQIQQGVPIKQTQQLQQNKDIFVVDDFESDETRNKIGSRSNIYVMAPSRVMISRRDDVISGKPTKVLMIKYDKKNAGGPGGGGGWCGYYTLIKNERTGQYLDGSGYKYITFWVKGQKGDENFIVGLADEHWDKIGDSLKSEEIGIYLEKGKITTQWQKAKVPLDIFFLDYATLSAVTINFEASCFPESAGSGVVFIDDIALEK